MQQKTYVSGQIIEGLVTGIQPYGAFVYVDEQTRGLIHISEISDFFVRDITHFVKVGDKVRVKVIEVDGSQLRLSLKAVRSYNRRRERLQRRQKIDVPHTIGFKTLAQALPDWIKEKSKDA